MLTTMKEQTFTFAVICQIVHLVQNLSRHGDIDEENLAMLLRSITITSPKNTLDVYGGELKNIETGLQLLITHLGHKSTNKDPEFTRYIVSLLNLERQLSKKPKQLAKLADRIEQTQRQLSHYDIVSNTLLSSFASIYSDLISPIGARIQIAGEPAILKQTINQDKIRSLLLAGIRAAVLWRQVGGKRRNILFARSRIVDCAKQMLQNI